MDLELDDMYNVVSSFVRMNDTEWEAFKNHQASNSDWARSWIPRLERARARARDRAPESSPDVPVAVRIGEIAKRLQEIFQVGGAIAGGIWGMAQVWCWFNGHGK